VSYLDAAFAWFFTWPHWAEYLAAGWLSYGFALHRKDVTPANVKGSLVIHLVLWWFLLIGYVLDFIHSVAVLFFAPENGLVAALLVPFQRAFRTRAFGKRITQTFTGPIPPGAK